MKFLSVKSVSCSFESASGTFEPFGLVSGSIELNELASTASELVEAESDPFELFGLMSGALSHLDQRPMPLNHLRQPLVSLNQLKQRPTPLNHLEQHLVSLKRFDQRPALLNYSWSGFRCR